MINAILTFLLESLNNKRVKGRKHVVSNDLVNLTGHEEPKGIF